MSGPQITPEVAESLRMAMRRFAATVSVVTVRHEGVNHGVTATSVTSVSLDPPSMVAILSAEASALAPLLQARRFCINFLAAGQEAISKVFASRQHAGRRFEHGAWSENGGYVLLENAQASVCCELRESLRVGTHVLCVGEVRQVRIADGVNPLIYLDGRYLAAGDCSASEPESK
jgi:flavin reductase (DIM6/NTAB) family NADH-FMN oxidoreductase RutF